MPKHGQHHGTGDQVLAILREQLIALAMPDGLEIELGESTLLIDDLGLDSFKFVELTVGLESAFGLDEFKMQEWLDERVERDEPLSVGSLAHACRCAIEQRHGSRP